MAMNAEEGRQMLEAARRAGKRLMINFSYRFTEQSMALKSQVEAASSATSTSPARSGTAGAGCRASAAGSARRRSPAAAR